MVRYKKKGGKSKAPSKAEFEFFTMIWTNQQKKWRKDME